MPIHAFDDVDEDDAAIIDEPLECLDDHQGGCTGTIEYRMSLSGTGRAIPRCDGHWDKRLDQHEKDNERYPDSPIAPAWFDEGDAGERWDDEY